MCGRILRPLAGPVQCSMTTRPLGVNEPVSLELLQRAVSWTVERPVASPSLHLEIMDHSLATVVPTKVAFIPHEAVRTSFARSRGSPTCSGVRRSSMRRCFGSGSSMSAAAMLTPGSRTSFARSMCASGQSAWRTGKLTSCRSRRPSDLDHYGGRACRSVSGKTIARSTPEGSPPSWHCRQPALHLASADGARRADGGWRRRAGGACL